MSEGVQITAVGTAIGLGLVALFQAAIALGAPFGRAAWGGEHAGVLPRSLRAASGVAFVVWSFAALVLLGRVNLGPLAGASIRWATWLIAGVLAVGTLMNAASRSPWERFGWAPFTLLLTAACAIVARG